MRALHRKLWRDLARLWSQALTIALVVGSAVAGFMTTQSTVASLIHARDEFYAQAHFADLFTSVRRAPLSALQEITRVPGVADAQATLEKPARLEIEGVSDPLMGRLVGMDDRQPRRLNQLLLRRGAQVQWAPATPGAALSDGTLPVWVSEAFAASRQLKPGVRLWAVLNGKRRALEVRAWALSPETVFAGPMGMPDQRSYGVLWVDQRALAAAWDFEGAFNNLALRLAPGAHLEDVLQAVTAVVRRYGGRDVHGREHQTSHAMLDNEIQEQRVIGTILPVLFMGIAAFLLQVVISRLIATHREQIAALKALGYSSATLMLHYLQLVLLITTAGTLMGWAAGAWAGAWLTRLYADFFRFPHFSHELPASVLWEAAVCAALVGVAATAQALRSSLRLSPAQAMQPPAPARYQAGWWERGASTRLRFPLALRMILRNLQRRPLRAVLTVLGMSAALGLVVLGNFFRDSVQTIVSQQFEVVMRGDVQVMLLEAQGQDTVRSFSRVPGVRRVESMRVVAATLWNLQRQQRVQLRGLPVDAELNRLIDAGGSSLPIPESGLVLTDRLARKLGLQVGDRVRIVLHEGRLPEITMTVSQLVQETMGLNASTSRMTLNQALGESDVANMLSVSVEPGAESAVIQATRAMPHVAGAFSKATLLRNMREISERNIRIMSTVMTGFAVIMAVGVVYNNARVSLAERAWELASMRVLGLTRAEVSLWLLGELGLLLLLAIPLGMWVGLALVHLMVGMLGSDQFRFRVVVWPRTYALAGACLLISGVMSAAVVRRRIDRLDLVGVLKTHE